MERFDKNRMATRMAKKKVKSKTEKKNNTHSKRNNASKKKSVVPKKRPPHRFVKGESGNPNGRPKGSKNKFSIALLQQAIKEVEREKRKPWLKHLVKKSYEDTALAIALLRKMLPDLKSIEDIVSIYAPSMSDEEAQKIQDKMRKRFL